MRNILTNSEYNKTKSVLSQKMTQNNIAEPEANSVVENNIPKADNYQSKLLKLIPTEVIGVYIFINGVIQSSDIEKQTLIIVQYIVISILFIVNPVYLRYAANVTNKKQLIICTIGFVVWVLSLGNPFFANTQNSIDLFNLIGTITLPLYTLFVPIFIREK